MLKKHFQRLFLAFNVLLILLAYYRTNYYGIDLTSAQAVIFTIRVVLVPAFFAVGAYVCLMTNSAIVSLISLSLTVVPCSFFYPIYFCYFSPMLLMIWSLRFAKKLQYQAPKIVVHGGFACSMLAAVMANINHAGQEALIPIGKTQILICICELIFCLLVVYGCFSLSKVKSKEKENKRLLTDTLVYVIFENVLLAGCCIWNVKVHAGSGNFTNNFIWIWVVFIVTEIFLFTKIYGNNSKAFLRLQSALERFV